MASGIVAGFNPQNYGFDYAGVAFGSKLAIFDASDAACKVHIPAALAAEVYSKG